MRSEERGVNRLAPRLPVWPRRPFGAPCSALRSARTAKRAVLSGFSALVLLHLGLMVWLDHGQPRVRDPEYGKRLTAARKLAATGRPLVVCVGSSRLAMGLRPGVLSESDPALANLALAGSGPVMELMAYRRAVADGLRPAAVLIEYWPAFLDEEGTQREDIRIDVGRLRPMDHPLVREFFSDPDGVTRLVNRHTRNPWWEHRRSLMNQLAASWLPNHQRFDAMFAPIDDWGWLPGRTDPSDADRVGAVSAARNFYEPLFARYTVSDLADRALRQLIAECHAAGTPVALVYLPEAAGFTALMTATAKAKADAHLAAVRRDTGISLIDCRGWVPDQELPDGFHLTQSGAAELTPKLAAATREWLGRHAR